MFPFRMLWAYFVHYNALGVLLFVPLSTPYLMHHIYDINVPLPFFFCFICCFHLYAHAFPPSQDWNRCSVGCEFGFPASKTPDATFGIAPDPSVESILRSMESSQYYSENNINAARGWVRCFQLLCLPAGNDMSKIMYCALLRVNNSADEPEIHT